MGVELDDGRRHDGPLSDVEATFGGHRDRSESMLDDDAEYSDVRKSPPRPVILASPRRRLMRMLDSVGVQASILAIILLDVCLTIYQISADVNTPDHVEPTWMFTTTLLIVCALMTEVCLRMFGLGPTEFFKHWSNSLDLAISALSLVLELIVFCSLSASRAAAGGGDATAASNLAFVRVLRPLARITRVCRVGTRAYRQHKQMQTAARHVVGGNKRRYTEDGFDLDLVYVTEKLIGMSVPAHGGMSLYRNPIDEVARFFRIRHPGAFLIYNCTTECSYPAEPFGGQVRRVPCEDHNVPPLEAIVAFCRDLEERSAERPEMCFALHCRGGKGRTGLMVCAWLLWSRHSQTAEQALAFWAERRTDETIRGKLQGVQTMSQVRYVRYVERLVQGGARRALSTPRRLRRLRLRNLLPELTPSDDALPWAVLSQCGPLGRSSLDTKYRAEPATLTKAGADLVVELGGYEVAGDLKIEIFCDKAGGLEYLLSEAAASPDPRLSVRQRHSASVKGHLKGAFDRAGESVLGHGGADGAPPVPGADRQLVLYAWVHTSMLGEEATLELPCSELDKGHKGLFKRLKARGVELAIELVAAEGE